MPVTSQQARQSLSRLVPCRRVANDVDAGSRHAIEIVLQAAYRTRYLNAPVDRCLDCRTNFTAYNTDKLASQQLSLSSNVVAL